MRLAWFTPWPPDRSGIAGRSAELVPVLAAAGHGIDVFVDERRTGPCPRQPDAGPAPGAVRVSSAHDFVWRQRRGQYDLAVYQIGNSRLHEFLWPYLFRWPGLAVFHDARIHHARGRALLAPGRPDAAAYRAEFAWNHPDVPPDAAELAIRGFDGPYYYQWPMTRAVLAASRLAVTHSHGAVEALRETAGTAGLDVPVEYVALGEGRATPPADAERRATREALGLPPDAVVAGVFGGLTPEKRVELILRAFAAVASSAPAAHLALVGTPDPRLDLAGAIHATGLGDRIHVIPPPPDDDAFDRAIGAVDVSLHLRWPTALETSGPWLRALAAGRATVVVDLAHQTALPTLDPRTWQPHAPAPPGPAADPVAVAIDILDEAHSLRRALARLVRDAGLRADLGRAARAYWTREHTLARMADDYARVLPLAAARPAPATPLPPHLTGDPLRHARALAAEAGVVLPSEIEIP
ncbi:MAG: hypothetical protein R2752_20620 [Vicinamibacterales bacterium]